MVADKVGGAQIGRIYADDLCHSKPVVVAGSDDNRRGVGRFSSFVGGSTGFLMLLPNIPAVAVMIDCSLWEPDEKDK